MRPIRYSPRLVLAACVASGLPACEQEKRDEDPTRIDVSPHVNAVRQAERDWAWISGTTWRLSAIEGEAPISGAEPWIRFEDHTWLVGSGGCNRLTGSYERRGIDGLDVSALGVTRMMCAEPDGIMQQEARFLRLLDSCDSYAAQPEALRLLVDNVEVLRFTSADATTGG